MAAKVVLVLVSLFLGYIHAYHDSACSDVQGTCLWTTQDPCYYGVYKSGKCAGPVDRKCCVPYDDGACTRLNGKCQYSTSRTCSSGKYVSGKCGGPWNRKCCIPSADSACMRLNGKCQHTSRTCSWGKYGSGKCGGPWNRKCCISSADSACMRLNGKCQYTSQTCFGDRYYVSGKCGGPWDRKCCISSGDSACTELNGKCQYTNQTCFEGRYVSGKCSGHWNRKCCISSGFTYDCMKCICKTAGCTEQIGKCRWDVHSGSCGPYQIKKPYYKDCGCPTDEGKSCRKMTSAELTANWIACTKQMECSETCVRRYMARHGKNASGCEGCEKYARLHHGGPRGCRYSSTRGYWDKVNSCCSGKWC